VSAALCLRGGEQAPARRRMTAWPREGSRANHDQEPWKAPLPQYIEHLYLVRFGRRAPDVVVSIEERERARKAKKAARKEARHRAREEGRQGPPETAR
jgi:hypothetical protein